METSLDQSDDVEVAHQKRNSYKLLFDSESSDDETEKPIEKPGKESINSSSESSESGKESDNSEEAIDTSQVEGKQIKDRKKKKIIVPKVQRKSAAKAMNVIKEKMSHSQHAEQKQKIQSEKQRMLREQEIRVPYHKPKQYSLKEFLARKSLHKPTSIEKLKSGNAGVSTIIAMKMASQNIEQFAQKLKEREEEAIEFFRSESESESEDNDNKENLASNPTLNESIPTVSTEMPNELKDEPRGACAETEVEPTCETSPQALDKNSELERLRLKYKDSPSISIIDPADIKSEEAIDVKPKFSLKTLNEMSSSDVIDLETGKVQPRSLTGPEILFQRYLQTVQKPKHKDSVQLNILSVENGKLENQQVEVKLNNEVELDHNRPGYSRELLKRQLRDHIVNKRIGEIKKKLKAEEEMNEFEPEDKPGMDDCADDEKGEDEESDEGMCEEEEILTEKKPERAQCGFLDEEAVDEDNSEEEEGDSDEESSEEEVEATSAAPKKSRIIRAYVDSDDEEINKHEETETEVKSTQVEIESQVVSHELFSDEMLSTPRGSEDVFSTQPSDFTFTEPSVSEEMRTQGIKAICDQGESQNFDDDLLEICSGQFEPTQVEPSIVPTETSAESQFISQVAQPSEVEPADLPAESPLKNNRMFLESSDDEVDAEVDKKRKKKKKREKLTKKLGFSDEEEEEESADDLPEEEEEIEESDGELEEPDDVEPLYDSEENEVEETIEEKKERVKAAGKFFEDEAELSESEWGSADEDEKDLDKFDIELGDEDEFDQNQLQEEVGRIHARKLLDDDIRNVKKIEELLFENEEIDGVGRERKFRWKNQDKDFPVQDENARGDDQLEEDDFEEEIAWRKMRHEREVMLSEQSLNLTDSEKLSEEIILLDHNSQVTSSSACSFSKRKFNVVKTPAGLNTTTIEAKPQSPFLITAASLKKYQKSSFLSRDEATLSRIARFVSHKSVNDEASNMSSNTSNSMSFMTVEKPVDDKKRKSDERSNQEPSKKRRIEGRNLLDQLK